MNMGQTISRLPMWEILTRRIIINRRFLTTYHMGITKPRLPVWQILTRCIIMIRFLTAHQLSP